MRYNQKKLLFKVVEKNDLHDVIDDLKNNTTLAKQAPRFIVVTDFELLLAIIRMRIQRMLKPPKK